MADVVRPYNCSRACFIKVRFEGKEGRSSLVDACC